MSMKTRKGFKFTAYKAPDLSPFDKLFDIFQELVTHTSGDVEEALNAASAIGDDTLQRQSRGTVVPESFTHGTSAQRQRWFRTGLQTGNPDSCDTFSIDRV